MENQLIELGRPQRTLKQKIKVFLFKNVVNKWNAFKLRHLRGIDVGHCCNINRKAKLDGINPKGIHIGNYVRISQNALALACISPKQAGLTVLESMGYGVPFITHSNAITGGEVLNIHNGIDGVIFEDDHDLVNIIKEISINPSKYIEMGQAAKKFYDQNRTIDHMAKGLWNAIQYAYDK